MFVRIDDRYVLNLEHVVTAVRAPAEEGKGPVLHLRLAAPRAPGAPSDLTLEGPTGELVWRLLTLACERSEDFARDHR